MFFCPPPFITVGAAYPTLVQAKVGGDTGRTTSFTVAFNTPAVAGNILAVECAIERNNNGPSAAPSGWSIGYLNLDATSGIRSSLFYKAAAGGETSVTVTFGNNGWAYVFREFGLANSIIIGTGVVGSSNAPDPPLRNPGTAKSRLFVASAGFTTASLSSYPSGYTSGLTATGTNSARLANAILQTTGTSENPGAYGLGASNRWTANTWAVEGL